MKLEICVIVAEVIIANDLMNRAINDDPWILECLEHDLSNEHGDLSMIIRAVLGDAVPRDRVSFITALNAFIDKHETAGGLLYEIIPEIVKPLAFIYSQVDRTKDSFTYSHPNFIMEYKDGSLIAGDQNPYDCLRELYTQGNSNNEKDEEDDD